MTGTTLGLDVGGTFAKSVLLDSANEVAERRMDRVPDRDVLAFVGDLVAERAAETRFEALGVGVAGLVRWPEGEFVWGPHVAGRSVPYRRVLSERFRVPVVVDNDANLAALAEARLGAGRGYRHVVMLTFGTGIGAGLVLNGSLYRGASFAGEVGHLEVESDGDVCACGRSGCWETRVSGTRLDVLAGELAGAAPDGALAGMAGSDRPSGRHLTQAADSGDPAARRVLAEAGSWLGRGVAMLATVLDPECVVVGGAAADAGEWLLTPARASLAASLAGNEHRGELPLIAAELGRWAGAIGAALLARDGSTGDRADDEVRYRTVPAGE